MKNKILAGFFGLLILIFSIGIVPVSAESVDTVAEAQSFIDGIVDFQKRKGNVNSIQTWIDGPLAQNAGVGAEWYIFALSQSGDYRFSSYEEALLLYLENNEIYSASSRQKYALILSAIGSTDGYISSVLNHSIGKQGIMSWVYGLHLLNNGYISSEYTSSEVIEKILSFQCGDGGWSITGQYGDVDVTAMTVQALSLHYNTDFVVKEAVDEAFVFLASRQLDDGGYASYGVSNPESVAQVIVALSSLGIDCETDERFIKNGNTLFDGISKYCMADGSFCHQEGGASSEIATAQVFYAMVSYIRMANDKSTLYMLDLSNPAEVEPEPEILPSDSETTTFENLELDEQTTAGDRDNENTDPITEPNKQGNYKPWVCLTILGVSAVVCLVLYLMQKRNIKNFIAVLVAAGILVLFVCVTNFQTAEDYYNGEKFQKENVIGTVTLTIRCDTIVGKATSEYIPEDGVILDWVDFEIEEGDSVYDILIEAARKYHILIDSEGISEIVYIKSIHNLKELQFGDLSGWVYHVNGVSPSVGCGEYKLSDGDQIEWLYTCNLGNDVK